MIDLIRKRHELRAIESVIEQHERAIAHRRESADNVRALIERLSGEKPTTQLSLLKDDVG